MDISFSLEKASNFTAFFCGLFVMLPFRLKPYTVFVFFVLGLFSISKSKTRQKLDLKTFLIFNLLTIIYAISLFFSNNLQQGFIFLGRMIPTVFIPLVYSFLTPDTKQQFNQLFKKTFIITSCLYSVLIFFYLFQLGYFSHKHNLSYCYSYIENEFYGINEHPIYISVYFSIALLFLLIEGFKSKFLNYFLFFILIVGLFILSRKGPIVSFFVVAFLFVILKKEKRQLYILLLVFVGFFSIALFLPESRNRFLEIFIAKNVVNNSHTSSGIRKILWKTSEKLIQKSNYLGYGVGDVQEVLSNQLNKDGFTILAKDNYNAHNQYLHIGLSTGVLGVFAFLFSIFYFIRCFIQSKNWEGIVFLLLFIFVFLFESFLERQNGIIIYSFLSCLFIYSSNLDIIAEDEK
jgi:O-antigen ligase